jgi:hypothetical protein
MSDDDGQALYRCPMCGTELEGSPSMELRCEGTADAPHAPAPLLRALRPRQDEPAE